MACFFVYPKKLFPCKKLYKTAFSRERCGETIPFVVKRYNKKRTGSPSAIKSFSVLLYNFVLRYKKVFIFQIIRDTRYR